MKPIPAPRRFPAPSGPVEHTDLDSGVFIERVEEDKQRFGHLPGQILPGHNAPDALVVRHLPPGEWVYAEDLAVDLFGEGCVHERSGRPEGKYISRLYTLAKKGFLESVVLWPNHKRFYRVLDSEKLRATVATKFLSRKYT